MKLSRADMKIIQLKDKVKFLIENESNSYLKIILKKLKSSGINRKVKAHYDMSSLWK